MAAKKKLTTAKAKKILKEGVARGKKLTSKQKKFFGAVAGGQTPKGGKKSVAKKTRPRSRKK